MKNKLGDRMIKQLLNSVIAKYRDLSVSRRSIIYLSRITDLLATDKSWYFAQPRPIIVNYLSANVFSTVLVFEEREYPRRRRSLSEQYKGENQQQIQLTGMTPSPGIEPGPH